MMNVSVFLKLSDTGKEPSVRVLFEPPATVELGLCFQLLIMSFTILSSLRWIARVQTVVSGLPRIGSHSYCCDSHRKLVCMELNTFKPWLVRPAMGSFVRLAVLNVSLVAARKATARHMSASPAAIERQDADDPNRLAGRCRSKLQGPHLDSVLTVCLIDQYLDRRPVPRRHLQLVEVAARLITAKFEEICPSEVQVFVYITTDAYTRDELPPWMAAHFLELVG